VLAVRVLVIELPDDAAFRSPSPLAKGVEEVTRFVDQGSGRCDRTRGRQSAPVARAVPFGVRGLPSVHFGTDGSDLEPLWVRFADRSSLAALCCAFRNASRGPGGYSPLGPLRCAHVRREVVVQVPHALEGLGA
jgi:hypothetical protein